MNTSKRSLLISLLVVAVSVLSFQSQVGAKENVLIYARPANGPLDPATLGSEESAEPISLVYNSLTTFTKDGDVVPGLAESWEISTDYKDYTFHLRRGVKFHDGSPFNAHAIKFSYDRLLRVKRVAEGSYLEYADENSCEVEDDYIIKIHLQKPFPLFLIDVSSPAYAAMSPDYVEKHATPDDPEALKWMTDHACGTGPFKLVEAIPGQRLVFKKFDEYWGGGAEKGKTTPKVDKVVFQVVEDPSTARLMLERGDVDIAEKLLVEQFEKLKTTPGIKVVKYSIPKIVYITYDVSKPPFSDIKVRKAISYAINYEEIIEQVERGDVKRLHGLIASGILGHNPELGYPFDLAKAEELMKNSDHPKGFTTSLIFAPERRIEFEEVALYIQAYLKKIGINVKIEKVAFDTQLAKMEKGNYGMSLMTWTDVMPDPDDSIGWLYDMSRGYEGGWNGSFWYDKDVEAKVRKAREMADPVERKAIYQEVDLKAVDQAIYVYLYELNKKFAMRENIKNFFYGPTNRSYFWLVEKE